MGKLNMGILGGFSGTVGTVVGMTNKKGDDIIRARSKKPRTSNSEGQVNQRTKFGLVTGFMQPLNVLLKVGFKAQAGTDMSPYNYACKQALNKAITGNDTDFSLNYGDVLISEGSLARATNATAALKNGKVEFSWEISDDGYVGNNSDNAVLVVYNVDSAELSYSAGSLKRSDKSGVVGLPYNESGDTIACYLFFQSATDALQVSTSVLAGTLITA